MKQPPSLSTGEPSYLVVASTPRSVSPTDLTVSKLFRDTALERRLIDAQYLRSRAGIQARGCTCTNPRIKRRCADRDDDIAIGSGLAWGA